MIDLYARDVVAYSISKHPFFEQVQEMMDKAFEKYPEINGLVIHSDMGWQYQYYKYINILKDHGIIQSMSNKGNCLDNAVVESFFGILKKEMFYGNEFKFKSYEDLKSAIDEYIFYYNNERRKHNLNGYTPSSFRASYKERKLS